MKRKTKTRIISAVLATQIPLSVAAQAVSPLTTIEPSADLTTRPVAMARLLNTVGDSYARRQVWDRAGLSLEKALSTMQDGAQVTDPVDTSDKPAHLTLPSAATSNAKQGSDTTPTDTNSQAPAASTQGDADSQATLTPGGEVSQPTTTQGDADSQTPATPGDGSGQISEQEDKDNQAEQDAPVQSTDPVQDEDNLNPSVPTPDDKNDQGEEPPLLPEENDPKTEDNEEENDGFDSENSGFDGAENTTSGTDSSTEDTTPDLSEGVVTPSPEPTPEEPPLLPDAPTPTETPEPTASPEATTAPEETPTPEPTETSEATENPEATASPEATADPEATDAPEDEDLEALLSTAGLDLYAASSLFSGMQVLMVIGGYGPYSTGMADDKAVEGTKYNLEWEGDWIHTDWSTAEDILKNSANRRVYYSAQQDTNAGIRTAVYSLKDKMFSQETHQLTQKAVDELNDYPRIPDMQFAGWYLLPSFYSGSSSTPGLEAKTGVPMQYYAGIDTYAYENRDHTKDITLTGEPIALDVNTQQKLQSLSAWRISKETKISGLALIGKWEKSTNATATDLHLYTVSTDGAGKGEEITTMYPYSRVTPNGATNSVAIESLTNAQLDEVAKTSFDNTGGEYFVRVPHDVDKLDFDLTTYEPGSTLTVTVTYGEEVTYTSTSDGETAIVGTESTLYYDNTGKVVPYGTYKARPSNYIDTSNKILKDSDVTSTGPARKTYTLDTTKTDWAIPLGEYAWSTSTSNRIDFTVTAPDGITTKTYTVYVQRLAEPSMTLAPGNTPYGLIAKEAADRKDQSPKYVEKDEQNKFDNSSQLPAGLSATNGGNVYTGLYNSKAWGKRLAYNGDTDKTAIVVYENASFRVPSFSVTTAAGNLFSGVDDNIAVGAGCVDWSLTVDTVPVFGPDVATDADVAGQGTYTITKSGNGGSDIVKLQDLSINNVRVNVKPGIYDLVYTYTDPYEDPGPDGTNANVHTNIASRKVIVLPLPGDVDMDGEVTVADGVMLQRLLDSAEFRSDLDTNVTKAIYWYRVCNVDGSNYEVDENDVKRLLNGYDTPAFDTNKQTAEYFVYTPTYDPADGQSSRIPPLTSPPSDTLPNLKVTYLGPKTDTGFDPTAAVTYNANDPSVFWVGLQLTDADRLDAFDGDLTTFTFTLGYNSAALTPYCEGEGVAWQDYIMQVNTKVAMCDTCYATCGTDQIGQPCSQDGCQGTVVTSPWTTGSYTLLTDPCGSELTTPSNSKGLPANHPSKANTKLTEASLREIRFSVQGSGADLKDGMLLLVPFQLTGYPAIINVENGQKRAPLVEAGLGMRDFTITTADGSAGVWVNQEKKETKNTVTTNLAGTFALQPSDTIPIGANETPGIVVQDDKGNNPVYGDYFEVELKGVDDTSKLVTTIEGARLPEGLEYIPGYRDEGGHRLKGTPTETGEFTFFLTTESGVQPLQFQIYVERAPLTLIVDPVTMYYGQDPTKPGDIMEKTFRYDTTGIKALDNPSGKELNGTMEELAGLLAESEYQAPDRNLFLDPPSPTGATTTRVSTTTPPGDYYVIIQNGRNVHYRFLFATDVAEDGTYQGISENAGYAKLTILPRPIQVTEITKKNEKNEPQLAEIYDNSVDGNVNNGIANYKDGDFAAEHVAKNGTYGKTANGIDIPLSAAAVVNNDAPVLTFRAQVDNWTSIKLAHDEEFHDATVLSVALPQSAANVNSYYTLVNDPAKDGDYALPEDNTHGRILVKRQSFTGLELTGAWTMGQGKLNYIYGESLELGNLHLKPTYDEGDSSGTGVDNFGGSTWNSKAGIKELYEKYGVMIQWVDNENDPPQPVDPEKVATGEYGDEVYPDMAIGLQHITVKEHNNKWLCITSVRCPDTAIYLGPITVEKKTLTITPLAGERYYGEENDYEDYTFDFDNLAEWDKPSWVAEGHYTYDRSFMETRLVKEGYVTGFTGLKLTYRIDTDITAGVVQKNTPVGTCYLVATGAVSDNYTFVYARDPLPQGDSAGATYKDFGYAPYTIHKRPLMVTQIVAPAATILFDVTSPVTWAVASAGKGIEDGYKTQTLQKDNLYWPRLNGSGLTPNASRVSWNLSDYAILDGDVVTVQYQATFAKDADRVTPPFWTVTDESGVLIVPVEIENLTLTDEGQSGNYELAFPYITYVDANDGNKEKPYNGHAAKGWTAEQGDKNNPSTPYKRNNSEGHVTLREIEKIVIVKAPPQADSTGSHYTYGGDGNTDDGTLHLLGMSVQIYYKGTAEPLTVTELHGNEFEKRGLTFHWRKEDGTAGEQVTQGMQLSVADSGKTLTVQGQALATHKPVYAETYDNMWDRMKVTVVPHQLTLTVQSQVRVYGEKNAPFVFDINANDLAAWDKKAIEEAGYEMQGGADGVNILATSAALALIDDTFEGPTFDTAAVKTTNVGVVDLHMSGGAMKNYVFSLKSGTITIWPRPLSVEHIVRDPIITVPKNAKDGPYTAVCFVGHFEADRRDEVVFSLDTSYYRGVGDRPALTMTESAAVLPTDDVALSVTFSFSDGATAHTTSRALATVTDLALTYGKENYVLGDSHPAKNEHVYGEVRDNWIEKLEIYRTPRLDYRYGEALTLDHLQLKVYFDKNTTGDPRHLSELGDLVRAFYWDYDGKGRLPNDTEMAEMWDDPKWRAQTEDTLYVDSLHGNAHDGMYLVILAKKAAGSTEFLDPLLVPQKLTVEKLPLQYKLIADDKVYDTTDAATGSFELLNVQREDKVWITNGIDYNNSPFPVSEVTGDPLIPATTNANSFWLQFATIRNDPALGTVAGADAGVDKYVNVYNMSLSGNEAGNYTLGVIDHIAYGERLVSAYDWARPAQADIAPAPQEAPGVTRPDLSVELSLDQRTNTLLVTPSISVDAFRNPNDLKKDQLYYEYRLVYLDENGTRLDELPEDDELYREPTAWQKGPYFGGEDVGQTAMAGDIGFGRRLPLSRGVYVMAEVRLYATDNYQASLPTVSSADPATDILASLTDLPAAEEGARLPERKDGPVMKTYTYCMELWTTQEAKDPTTNETTNVVKLADVIFTDIAQFKDRKELDRLVGNVKDPVYSNYYWDTGKKVPLAAELDLTQPIEVEMAVTDENGITTTQKVQVNAPDANGNVTLKIYADPVFPVESGPSGPSKVFIEPDELTAKLGDEPVQLEVRYQPVQAKSRTLVWTSSDESVATVSKDGVVTFVGVGEATITVRTSNNKSCSILVTVTEAESVTVPYADTMFNAGYTEPYMEAPQGIFGPERPMTRGEVVLVMARFFQESEKQSPIYGKDYRDMTTAEPCADQVENLTRWGIVNGVEDDLFAPDQFATRAEMATILCRMLMLPLNTDPDGPHAFQDVTGDHWAWAYIDALVAAGITNGTGEGTYSPDRAVTRAELATFLARILATRVDMEQPDLIVPEDVTEEHWAYSSILRAVNTGAMDILEK